MILGLISDTHDRLDLIDKVIDKLNSHKVDLTIHCGDFVSPFALKRFKRLKSDFLGVFGNNDGELLGLCDIFPSGLYKSPYSFELKRKRFVVMHEPLFVDELVGNYDFIFYGHTHRLDVRKIGKTTIINPGEVCGYITGDSTFVLVDILSGDVVVDMVY